MFILNINRRSSLYEKMLTSDKTSFGKNITVVKADGEPVANREFTIKQTGHQFLLAVRHLKPYPC